MWWSVAVAVFIVVVVQPSWTALDTATVIAIQNELTKHTTELEMLLDHHVKNLNARVGEMGRPGPPGINGSPGFPEPKGQKGENGIDGKLGKPGVQGIPGMKGDMGPIGSTGMKNEKGSTEEILKEISEMNGNVKGEKRGEFHNQIKAFVFALHWASSI